MTLKARKKTGDETVAKYQIGLSSDKYSAAVDAISDILLAVAQSDSEATQMLQQAEIEFRNLAELETFVSEG